MPGNISVTILTKNSGRHLRRVLKALALFDEVLLLDNGSEDETLVIAKEFPNVRIETSPFLGFGPLHNKAAHLAKHDWILSIDSDEVLSPELALEIASLKLDPKTIYAFERHTYYRDKLVTCCGWYPDVICRLFHRKETQFSTDAVHEKILDNGLCIQKLRAPIWHYSYDSVSDFLKKMQQYTDLYASQWTRKKRSSPFKAFLHAFGAFIRNYFLKKGMLNGYRGYLIATYQAQTAFYKYLKLYEANLDQK